MSCIKIIVKKMRRRLVYTRNRRVVYWLVILGFSFRSKFSMNARHFDIQIQ